MGADELKDLEKIAPPRYKLLGRIGEGGSGTVFKAKDLEGDRLVAFKSLRPGEGSGDARTSRFLRGAAVIAELDHPNIVKIFDHGIHLRRPYLVMEFVPGVGLDRILERGPLREMTTIRICLKLAEILEYIHTQNIIHRDLKPSNIIVKKGGIPVMVDFGFMKSYAEDFVLEESGVTLGTPAYMAPELVEGDLHGTDGRTDLFSLGAVLYEMLTGSRPFPAQDPEGVFKQILRMRPDPPRKLRPEVSEGVEKVCLTALAKEPDERYPSAKQMANALGRLLLTGHL